MRLTIFINEKMLPHIHESDSLGIPNYFHYITIDYYFSYFLLLGFCT
jgi:hypothetical protein